MHLFYQLSVCVCVLCMDLVQALDWLSQPSGINISYICIYMFDFIARMRISLNFATGYASLSQVIKPVTSLLQPLYR